MSLSILCVLTWTPPKQYISWACTNVYPLVNCWTSEMGIFPNKGDTRCQQFQSTDYERAQGQGKYTNFQLLSATKITCQNFHTNVSLWVKLKRNKRLIYSFLYCSNTYPVSKHLHVCLTTWYKLQNNCMLFICKYIFSNNTWHNKICTVKTISKQILDCDPKVDCMVFYVYYFKELLLSEIILIHIQLSIFTFWHNGMGG